MSRYMAVPLLHSFGEGVQNAFLIAVQLFGSGNWRPRRQRSRFTAVRHH